MAKQAKVKLTPVQHWDGEVKKWTQRREDAIVTLVKASYSLRDAQRGLERAKRSEAKKKREAKLAAPAKPLPKESRKAGQKGFEVGNQVCVSEAADATIFEIVRIEPDGSCFIREEGRVNGQPYAEQCSHTSLLKHAVTDEMLQAFSQGKLKAGRKTKLSV